MTYEEAMKEALFQARTSTFSTYNVLVYYDPIEDDYFVSNDWEQIWPENVHPERFAFLQEKLKRSQKVWTSEDKQLY